MVRGTFIRVFEDGDVLIAVDANNQFDDGVITTQAAFRFSERETTVAITGGTGAFARARGTVTRQVLADNDTVQFTFDVLP